MVLDYGRDDHVRAEPAIAEETLAWSRRDGWYLTHGFRVRVIHAFWTFADADEAHELLVAAFGEPGSVLADGLAGRAISHNVAVYHGTAAATALRRSRGPGADPRAPGPGRAPPEARPRIERSPYGQGYDQGTTRARQVSPRSGATRLQVSRRGRRGTGVGPHIGPLRLTPTRVFVGHRTHRVASATSSTRSRSATRTRSRSSPRGPRSSASSSPPSPSWAPGARIERGARGPVGAPCSPRSPAASRRSWPSARSPRRPSSRSSGAAEDAPTPASELPPAAPGLPARLGRAGPPSSRGLGRHPFKVEITGSNPVGGTTRAAGDRRAGRGRGRGPHPVLRPGCNFPGPARHLLVS